MDDAAASSLDRGEALASWPLCPDCRRRRLTACRYCGTAGTDFRLVEPAYTPGCDDDANPRLWVLCPLCDDAFAAPFFRRCEWCGFDFQDGLDLDALGLATDRQERITVRALIAAALLLVALLLACGYFALLTAG